MMDVIGTMEETVMTGTDIMEEEAMTETIEEEEDSPIMSLPEKEMAADMVASAEGETEMDIAEMIEGRLLRRDPD